MKREQSTNTSGSKGVPVVEEEKRGETTCRKGKMAIGLLNMLPSRI